MALATCPPGLRNLPLERNFARVGRKAGNDQKRVGGVQADAHHVIGRHQIIVEKKPMHKSKGLAKHLCAGPYLPRTELIDLAFNFELFLYS